MAVEENRLRPAGTNSGCDQRPAGSGDRVSEELRREKLPPGHAPGRERDGVSTQDLPRPQGALPQPQGGTGVPGRPDIGTASGRTLAMAA